MTEWQEFVKNRLRLQGADSQPLAGLHQPAAPRHDPGTRATHLPERRRLRGAVFGVVAAFLGDDTGLIVDEIEAANDDWNERG
jgi:hypothetical protein